MRTAIGGSVFRKRLNRGLSPISREQLEAAKAQLRAKVEHPFHVIKNLFGHRKTRYKGLAKNTAQLYSLFGLANLLLAARLSNAIDSQAVPG